MVRKHSSRVRHTTSWQIGAVTLAIALVGSFLSFPAAQEPGQVTERQWPKELPTAAGGKLVVYQPQVETWTDYARLDGRVALAYASTEDATPLIGTARITARSDADSDSRLVRVHSLVLDDVRFPSLSAGQSQILAAELKRHADSRLMKIQRMRSTCRRWLRM